MERCPLAEIAGVATLLTDYRALFADLFGHVFGLGNESVQRIFTGVHPTNLALV